MQDLLLFMNAQRERTPRGIAQIKTFPTKQGRIGPNNNLIMANFQRRKQLNCTVWAEGMWEMFSAKNCQTKFLLSDDPVTLYNCDCYPASPACTFPMTRTHFGAELGCFTHCLLTACWSSRITNMQTIRKVEGARE